LDETTNIAGGRSGAKPPESRSPAVKPQSRPANGRGENEAFGIAAIDCAHDGAFGQMVALQCGAIIRVPLSAAVAELKTVDPELVAVAEVFYN